MRKTGGRHIEIISSPRREVLRQLSQKDHTEFHGEVANWFQRIISLERNKVSVKSGCWQTSAGTTLCSGQREDIRDLVLSIPVILIIEIADDDVQGQAPSSWRFSEHLFPLPLLSLKEAMNTGMIYELTGLGFYSQAHLHFIARFSSLDRKVVYTYDGRANEGFAVPEKGATSSSHLSAPSIPLPNSYKVCSAIYKL